MLYMSNSKSPAMKKSKKYEKAIMDLSNRLFDPSLSPEEKEKLEKDFFELNRLKSIEIQKELMEDLEPSKKKKGLFEKISDLSDTISSKFHSKLETIQDAAFETMDTAYYSALEDKVNYLLEHPENIQEFFVNEYDTFVSLFSCQGPSRLEETIDLNLEKDFRLVSGSDLTPELKEGLRTLFTSHRDAVSSAIKEVIEKEKADMLANIGYIEVQDIPELVTMEISGITGEARIDKLAEVYCRVILNRKHLDNSPVGIESAYKEVSSSFYRNLKIEMDKQGIWDKKRYAMNLEFDDPKIQQVWKAAKEKILQEMEYDPYLG